MKILLDTHTFLWWTLDDPRLSAQARAILKSGQNTLLLSAATGWEIAIKVGLGKMSIPNDPLTFIMDQARRNRLDPLAIDLAHTLHVYTLPDIHRDPFDRILIAQSQIERVPILTMDPQIGRYEVEVIW